MRKHWAKFLIGGTGAELSFKVDDVQGLYGRAERLKRELQSVENNIKILESEILDLVNKEWTTQEILNARDAAANTDL